MKKRKSFNRDFNAFENRTTCYIHYENIEIPVYICRERNTIKLNFTFNKKTYSSEEIEIFRSSDLISSDLNVISFNGIVIKDTDRRNLASCIDRMFDNVFNN